MDLGRCPKCGSVWGSGEFCGSCGFVAIGAGVRAKPKGRKKRRKYVEPGSWTPFLVFIFLSTFSTYLFLAKPWSDDWAEMRLLLGQGRPRNVRGDWEITKIVRLAGNEPGLVNSTAQRGMLRFSKNGRMRLSVQTPTGKMRAGGNYQISGRRLTIEELTGEEGNNSVYPSSVKVHLTWPSRDTFLARVGKAELIYARRKAGENDLVRMLRFGLNPRAIRESGRARGQIVLSEQAQGLSEAANGEQ